MGTSIKTIATVFSDQAHEKKHDSTKIAAKAARLAIQKAQINADRIGILINTGVYRTDNIGEPAIAAIIQDMIKDEETSLSNQKDDENNRTFAFDLLNGGCGLINAIQIVDNMLQNGPVQKGLVVTVDVEPIPDYSDGYVYAPASAAMLLSSESSMAGFQKFESATYPEYMDQYKGELVFSKTQKKSILVIEREQAYLEACVACATQSIDQFLKNVGLTRADIDLIIPSQTPDQFAASIGKQPGFEGKVEKVENIKELHTAGPVFALEQAMNADVFSRAKNILFVTVGAGISTALALYQNP